jgi:hypothetical protein
VALSLMILLLAMGVGSVSLHCLPSSRASFRRTLDVGLATSYPRLGVILPLCLCMPGLSLLMFRLARYLRYSSIVATPVSGVEHAFASVRFNR